MLIAIGSSLVTATVLSWWGNFEPQGAETAARPAFESELEPADDELELPVVTEVEPQPEPVDHSFAITHAIAGERIGSALTVAYGRQARPERPPEPSPPNGPPQGLFGSVVIDR